MNAGALERLNAALHGRYHLEREVGQGGMATVYLAEDLRHHRRVALKLLKPELTEAMGAERFLKEIQVTAQLQHPHILPLFDSGAISALPEAAPAGLPSERSYLYYVMPFVEGESLRTRLDREPQLPLDTAFALVQQIAGALEHAHRRGVVHRDIKPENILIQDGQALVSDFGIALAASHAGIDRLTQTGLSVGSPRYMSPEQGSGERDVDARSDVYSLACVLYEMLAGDPPFDGRTAQAVLARKLTGVVPSLRPVRDVVTADLDRIIAKALARSPADRYATMAEFAQALTQAVRQPATARLGRRRVMRLAGTGAAAVLLASLLWFGRAAIMSLFAGPPRFARVAILPLENQSGDSTQNYLVDGITETLIADLARLERVDVISLWSVLGYRDAPRTVDAVARELAVDAVVTGSVLRNDAGWRVVVQLNAPGQPALASDTVQRPAEQVAELERMLVRALARDIGSRLAGPRTTAGSEHSPNAAAHDLYLRGRFHLASRTPEGLQNALDYFRQSLARDPAYAPAYAGLAQYYSLLPFYTSNVPADAFAKAKAAAQKALELDPFLPEAHGSLAYVLAYNEWDWNASERAYRRALALQPSNADLHHALSRLLAARGRMAESIAAAERSHALDPLSLVAHANIGIIAYFGRDYVTARRRLEETLQLDPNFSTAHWGLGLVYEQQGDYDQAIAAFEQAMAIAGRGRNTLSSLGHVLAIAGRKAEAEAIVEDLNQRGTTGPIQPYLLALVLAGLGRNDEALALLERSFEERSAMLSYLDRDPRFDSLRGSPRFTALLRRMNFAPAAVSAAPAPARSD